MAWFLALRLTFVDKDKCIAVVVAVGRMESRVGLHGGAEEDAAVGAPVWTQGVASPADVLRRPGGAEVEAALDQLLLRRCGMGAVAAMAYGRAWRSVRHLVAIPAAPLALWSDGALGRKPCTRLWSVPMMAVPLVSFPLLFACCGGSIHTDLGGPVVSGENPSSSGAGGGDGCVATFLETSSCRPRPSRCGWFAAAGV